MSVFEYLPKYKCASKTGLKPSTQGAFDASSQVLKRIWDFGLHSNFLVMQTEFATLFKKKKTIYISDEDICIWSFNGDSCFARFW